MSMIWKFPIPISDSATIFRLFDGKFRFAAMQNSQPHAWFECDPGCGYEDRCFRWFGTGHDIPPGSQYLASVIDGLFVWHLYEVAK